MSSVTSQVPPSSHLKSPGFANHKKIGKKNSVKAVDSKADSSAKIEDLEPVSELNLVECLRDITLKMRELDLCMMTTIGKDGMTASRPMSNNCDVDYDGRSFFFTWEDSKLVQDLKNNSHVNLSFSGKKNLFISVSGLADIVRNRRKMEKQWVPSLDQWFEQGLDTTNLVMIEVQARTIHLWQNEKEKIVEFS